MSHHQLDALAERYGVAVRYWGLDGVFHEVPDSTKRAILNAMGVVCDSDEAIAHSLAEAPSPVESDHFSTACFEPQWLIERRCWGVAIQLYALRSDRNWGIGDFQDLADIARITAAQGADFLGTNPLHALFLADPMRRSPFSPSNRRFLNPLYIAVDTLPGFAPGMADPGSCAALRATELVDYAGVAQLKLAVLEQVFAAWRQGGAPAPYEEAAFAAFVDQGGSALRAHALFEALSLHFAPMAGWHGWPSDYQDLQSPQVRDFVQSHADQIGFQLWLQWIASVQLEQAQQAARDAGMRIGLYLDFAVGEAPDGSASWGTPDQTMRGVTVGAPPDYFATQGQNWGLAPISPAHLRGEGISHYADMLAASMRSAGALRIDHAMGLRQLFMVPENASALEGAYVRYPLGAMVSALAGQSQGFGTLIVGEDLGNVPEGFRDIMARGAIYSYRIFYFERAGTDFLPPEHYPAQALACVSTHDLPTLPGWWRGDDIALRLSNGLIEASSAGQQSEGRQGERIDLVNKLHWYGLLDDQGREEALQAGANRDLEVPSRLIVGVHRYLARTPSRLLAVRIEDLVGQLEPVNLPGTVDSYPNWQRKLAVSLNDLEALPLLNSVTAALREERPR